MSSRPAVAAGAALAVLGDVVLRRHAPRYRTALQANGLVVAAGIYPALHRGAAEVDERQRELAGVAAAGAVAGAVAVLSRRPAGRHLLAAGWAAHAIFDAAHHRGATSLLPDWYPAVCAGYDVATAAALLTPTGQRRRRG